jgi:hypothetical protein
MVTLPSYYGASETRSFSPFILYHDDDFVVVARRYTFKKKNILLSRLNEQSYIIVALQYFTKLTPIQHTRLYSQKKMEKIDLCSHILPNPPLTL